MFFFDNNNIQVFEPCSVEHAYLAILKEDLDSAEKVFAESKSSFKIATNGEQH